MKIRRLRRSDIDGVLALFESVVAERIYLATEPGFDRERYRRRWEATIGSKTESCFVAVDAKGVAGELSIYDNQRFGPSLGMMVAAPYRGRGIGRKLVESALTWARRARLEKLLLRVFPNNAAAIGLYLRAGFKIVARLERDVPRANAEALDSILMEAMLARRKRGKTAHD
ncbi:MAG: GNAT family N-acetyltransferase [Candidatus Eremiobacteraeota bacterium]|nr:GNAT family N-acetyltransferase [Candidatus Eremiobacteraeota bacterium]